VDDHAKSFLRCSPVLSVDDAVKSAEFYREKLGFAVALTCGDPPYYVVVQRDDAVSIHFSEREDTSTKIPPAHVYIVVSDVDAVYDEYLAKGLRIFSPPEDLDSGMREFEVADLNGHFLTFGMPIE
jgi:uncharacterized glyoxalase superfamily protein PhnB